MHRLIFIAVLVLGTAVAGEHSVVVRDDSLERSREFVRNLELDCTLTDGYQCAEVTEDDFLNPDSWKKMVPAPYLAAWQSCYDDFRRIPDLSAEQKELRHYKVGFTENQTAYIVLFQGLQLPFVDEEGQPTGIAGAVFGRSVKYWVDKKTLKIIKRMFY